MHRGCLPNEDYLNLLKNARSARRWWHMPVMPALWEAEAGGISEFEASLFYRVSFRTARAIQRNPVSKKPNPKNPNK